MLHQTAEETKYGVTLKDHTMSGGHLTLDKTLAQIMDIMNATGTGLGSSVCYVIRGNENIKRTDTFTRNNTQINLL